MESSGNFHAYFSIKNMLYLSFEVLRRSVDVNSVSVVTDILGTPVYLNSFYPIRVGLVQVSDSPDEFVRSSDLFVLPVNRDRFGGRFLLVTGEELLQVDEADTLNLARNNAYVACNFEAFADSG